MDGALSVSQIIANNKLLCTLPDSVIKLNECMRKSNATITDITNIIIRDPVLSARILRVVNSPFYGFPSSIDNIPYAITILGTDSIRYLALSSSVINNFSRSATKLVTSDNFWRHSFACAVISEKLSKRVQHSATERFFTIGLFLELGSYLMALTDPDSYHAAIKLAHETNMPFFRAENQFFGFTHNDVTVALLRQWNFPDKALNSVKQIHNPDGADFNIESAILSIAESISFSIYPLAQGYNNKLPISGKAWSESGINLKQINQIIDEIDVDVENTMDGLYFNKAI